MMHLKQVASWIALTNRRQLRKVALALVAGWIALWQVSAVPSTVLAQSDTNPPYWQFSAPGRISQLLISDFNADGIDELVVAANDVSIVLVGADGRPLWDAPFRSEKSITLLEIARFTDENGSRNFILLATESSISLIDGQQNVVWERLIETPISGVVSTDIEGDADSEIVVTMENGVILVLDRFGTELRRIDASENIASNSTPRVVAAPIFSPERDTVSLIVERERFGEIILYDGEWEMVRNRPVSGRVTALTTIETGPARSKMVIGNTVGQLELYDPTTGSTEWVRTPAFGHDITAISVVTVENETLIIVGTGVGRVFAYDLFGRRRWVFLNNNHPSQMVTAISVNPASTLATEDYMLAVTIAPNNNDGSNEASVILLDFEGKALPDGYGTNSNAGLSRIIDVNRDGQSELLLVDFATIQLLDPGIGAGENFRDWEYQLNAAPGIALVTDLDMDGADELLIGDQEGQLHLLQADGRLAWQRALGGRIEHLAVVAPTNLTEGGIVVVSNNFFQDSDGVSSFSSNVRLLRFDGQEHPLWEMSSPLSSPITDLIIHSIRGDNRPEIIIGTLDGTIIAYSLTGGAPFWEQTFSGSVEFLAALPLAGNGRIALLAGFQTRQVNVLSSKGIGVPVSTYLEPIVEIVDFVHDAANQTEHILAVQDGVLHGLSANALQLWSYDLGAIPTMMIPAGLDTLILATDEGEVLNVAAPSDSNASIRWRIPDQGRVTTLHWEDLDDDLVADVAIGNREGDVQLYNGDDGSQWDALSLGSPVFFIGALKPDAEQGAELTVITNNGVVQHFTAQANRPPLIVNPQFEVDVGRYGIGVSILNIEENDEISVTLERFNPLSNQWLSEETRLVTGGGAPFFQLDPTTLSSEALRYRFVYDDGSHQGIVEPAPGPLPIFAVEPFNPWPITIAALVVVGAIGLFFYAQTRTLDARVRRFYGRLKQQPVASLQLIEMAYYVNSGSPDYLLSLASRARQDNNRTVAGIAEGLFLLPDRPSAGLPIINGALESADTQNPELQGLEQWQALFQTGSALFTAPSITEISLLRPRLLQTVEQRPPSDKPLISLEALIPILTSIRDSERVDLVEDRLVYLNEANVQLRQLMERIVWSPTNIERLMLSAIAERWSGRIRAEIEGLRGQARLSATLITKRIVPDKYAEIALEINNSGRAPAENIEISVLPDAAYDVEAQPAKIPFLPAGRSRQITFTIAPRVDERFRLACTISFDDRMQVDRTIPFGDMISLLPPQREFSPVRNPYAPGTPLRRSSHVFVGREDVFEFVAETVGRPNQQNVLILVGQRRTGKTSMLLRLGQHLPSTLLPVYIDCQSLGVVQGIAAFFHDLAWLIADALAERDIDIAVPSMAEWQENPANIFQRHFIPTVKELSPDENQLLLVFDEFEAFEDLVNKEILPPTLFTYLRHLMQHVDGLSFLFVGTHRLEEMSTDYWSVLFNIALYKEIDFLSRSSAIKLITEPVAPTLVYDDLALDKIWRVTAGHPYFLQLVCYSLVNQANKEKTSYVTISDVNKALHDMLRLGEAHFAYMWQLSNLTERILLTAVAHHVDPDAPFHPLDLAQYLERYNLRLQPADVTKGLDQLVERDIMREINAEGATLYELKIGLVGLWTARNKSLSKLYDTQSATVSKERRITRPFRSEVGVRNRPESP